MSPRISALPAAHWRCCQQCRTCCCPNAQTRPDQLIQFSDATLPSFGTASGAGACLGIEQQFSPFDSSPKVSVDCLAVGATLLDLDGKTVGVGNISASEPLLTWTHRGISQGPHNLTITKLSEARMGAAWLESISIDPSGHFLQPPPSPGMRTGRRMLFVGDSFTVGFANIGGASCSRSNASNQNALLGYGPLTARHFEADYQIMAWSGAGINVYPGLRQGSLYSREVEKAYYPLDSQLIYRQDALNPTSTYSMNFWVPQVIVLAGGTNDFHSTTLSEDHHVDDPALPPVHEWVDMYLDYVQQIRQLYPKAAIVNLVWPLEVQLVGVLTPEQTTVYLQYMAAAYSRLQMAGLSDVYMLQLTGEDIDNSNWCNFHPDVEADTLIAGQLIQFMEAVLPSLAMSQHA